jgi:hypothetical protein
MAKSNIYNDLSSANQSSISREEKQEDTRSTIARVFIFAYILIIAGLILLSTFFKLDGNTSKDYLLAISSPLGFIIGYYFKSGSKD